MTSIYIVLALISTGASASGVPLEGLQVFQDLSFTPGGAISMAHGDSNCKRLFVELYCKPLLYAGAGQVPS